MSAPSPAGRRLRFFRWGIASIVLLGAAAGVYLWRTRVPPIATVIVKPLSGAIEPSWLPAAITEEIVELLRPLTHAEADPAFTGVLEGTVTRAGDRILVVAQLSRPDGHRYWKRTFERPLADIGSDIAASIVKAPRRKPPRHKPAARAFDSYFEARHRFRAGEIAPAAEGFARATDADPEFALAWAWLSIAKEYLAEQGTARPNDVLPGARDAAERAVTLDPDSSDAHLALGIVKLQYDWKWDMALRELDRAAELSPGSPLVNEWRQRWLEAMGRAPVAPITMPNVPTDLDGAHRLLDRAEELRTREYVSPVLLVLAANFAHDTESLHIWLDAAYEERCVQLPYLLRSPALPQSDPLRAELIRRLKLPTNP